MPGSEAHKRAAALAERDAAQTRCEAAEAEREAAEMKQRPSVQYEPTLKKDGNKWCALYGDNLQEGCAGFGDTPREAMREFDRAWRGKS